MVELFQSIFPVVQSEINNDVGRTYDIRSLLCISMRLRVFWNMVGFSRREMATTAVPLVWQSKGWYAMRQ